MAGATSIRSTARCTALLLDAASGAAASNAAPPRLALFGAGNCLDVDLAALCRAYEEVHLVDLDGDTVAYARQSLADHDQRRRIFTHAPVDLTGVLDRADALRRRSSPLAELLAAAPRAAAALAARLPAPFDVVPRAA